jgi:hypothetical protein
MLKGGGPDRKKKLSEVIVNTFFGYNSLQSLGDSITQLSAFKKPDYVLIKILESSIIDTMKSF